MGENQFSKFSLREAAAIINSEKNVGKIQQLENVLNLILEHLELKLEKGPRLIKK